MKVRPVDGAEIDEALVGATGEVWSPSWVFEVPGAPIGKGRPRIGKARNGRPIAFTDSQTVAYENLVALLASRSLPPGFMTGPISVAIALKLPRTKDKKQPPPTVYPDVDNAAKAILDGLKHHFNDNQVTVLVVTKERAAEGEQPRAIVRIEQIQTEDGNG